MIVFVTKELMHFSSISSVPTNLLMLVLYLGRNLIHTFAPQCSAVKVQGNLHFRCTQLLSVMKNSCHQILLS